VGAFLSGGTDSSTVAGLLREIHQAPVSTYSIGFDAAGFDEMEYARIAAHHFGLASHEYYLKPADILEAIPLIAQAYDEPFANESAVPAHFCARTAAADGIKVMLAGDGGDEIFGGNARYAKQMVFEHYGQIPLGLRRHLIEPLVFNLPLGDKVWPLRKVQSYIHQAQLPLPERLESYNFLLRQPLEAAFQPGFLAQIDVHGPDEQMREVYFRTLGEHPIQRMMHLDLKLTLSDNDLRKVSRMTEAAGVEVRYPLLDDDLVALSGRLPPDYLVKGQYLRWFFKQALKDFLPKEIINKSKHGFGLPFGVWALQDKELKDKVQTNMAQFEKRGFLQPSYIHDLLKQHATGHANYFGKMIWAMVVLEEWLSLRGL
jgi:asparagine synthase (glutamine-hydrolysing)